MPLAPNVLEDSILSVSVAIMDTCSTIQPVQLDALLANI
jgi:hypothetical protein